MEFRQELFVSILEKEHEHRNQLISERTAHRFVELGLRIIESNPPIYFHRTITFPGYISDLVVANGLLDKLWHQLEKTWAGREYSIFHNVELRADGCVHFQASLMFFNPKNLPYDSTPEDFEKKLKRDLWQRWRDITKPHFQNEIDHNHNGQKLKKYEKFQLIRSLGYFMCSYHVAKRGRNNEKTTRNKTNPYGIRNVKEIEKRSTPKTKAQIKEAFSLLFVGNDWPANKWKAAEARHKTDKRIEWGNKKWPY